MANLTSQRHGDRWLADILSGSSAPHFPQAVAALAGAVKANAVGEYDDARQQADLAEQLFRASGNTAGMLRAEFEQTFSAQKTRRSEACRRQSIAAGAKSQRYSYPWVQIQLALEEGVCSRLMGDLGGYEAARRAQGRAQQAGYDALYLRALGFIAASNIDTGDRPGFWKLVCSGLTSTGHYSSPPFERTTSIQSWPTCEAAARPNLHGVLARSWALIESDGDLSRRAWAHDYMRNAAMVGHISPKSPNSTVCRAGRLFGRARELEASRTMPSNAIGRLLKAEAGLGRFDAAMALGDLSGRI